MEPRARARLEIVLPILVSLVFVALCATSLTRKSGTYDEYYVGIGTRLSAPEALFHPPLSFALHSLPFLWLEIPEEVWREPHGQLRGQRVVALRTDDWMLDAARLALLPMGVLLCGVVFVWGRRLYGFWGGLLPMALVALDPNVIAHARLITPDTTLAACTLLAAYRLWRLAAEPGAPRRLAAGVAFGLMLLSKYTALLLAPILLAADLAYRLKSAGLTSAGLAGGAARARPDLRRLAGDWAALLGIGALLLWAGYGFAVGPVVAGPGVELTLPAPRYLQGALFQWRQSQLPHDFFLLGQHSTEGWWFFYLVVLLVKLPLATLLLLGVATLGGRALGIRWRAEEVYLWLPPLLLLAYLSFLNTIHNGLRYLLPVLPLALLLVGRLAPLAVRSRAFRVALAAPVAWVAVASLWIWPDYLAYANELIGGPRNLYRVLSDSNLDWGQDLEQLADYMERHDIARVQLAYFGTADPRHYGIDYVSLPSPNTPLPPRALPKGEEPPRIVALSAYHYQGVAFPDKDHYAFFHRFEPNAQIGYSILIFDLDRLIPRQGAEAARTAPELSVPGGSRS